MPREDHLSIRRLEQARRLLALAQTGLHYTMDVFDRERYGERATLAQEQIAEIASMDAGKVAELFAFETGYANPKLDVSKVCCLQRDQSDIARSRGGRWPLVSARRLG